MSKTQELDPIPMFITTRNDDPPESEPAEPSSTTDHDLDTFRAADLDPGAGDPGGVIEADQDGQFPDPDAPALGDAETLSREVFWQTFKTAFAYPGMIDQDFKPLAIQPEETDLAHGASDATFDLLEEYAPGLLAVDDKWFKLAMVGQFLFLKIAVVREVFAEKRARRMTSTSSTSSTPEGDDQANPKGGVGWVQ